MDEVTFRRADAPYLLMAVGLVLLVVSWLTTWITIPLFFGISVEGGFWGARFTSGGDGEWASWFHEDWESADGTVMAGIGSIIGGMGTAAILAGIIVHFVPAWAQRPWARYMPIAALFGSLAVLTGCLLVRGGIVTALDGNVEAGDWSSGFWFAWVACAVLVGTNLAQIIAQVMSDRPPENRA